MYNKYWSKRKCIKVNSNRNKNVLLPSPSPKSKLIKIISASSAGLNGGDYAKITINNKVVEMAKNDNNDFRGLHIVIINSSSG